MADPNVKTETNNPIVRSWAQRAELISLGAVGTAIGVGIVDVTRRALARKVTEDGVRQAAAFGGILKSVFSR